MTGVKRYTFDIDERYLCDCGNGDRVIRVESGKDGYVTATDYDRLEQECERLRSVYEEDTRRITGVNALADDLKAERDELRAQIEAMREAVEFAYKSLSQITSSDGSGHSDIALSVLRLAGMNAVQRETLVEGWKAKATWRIDAALQAKT